MKFFTTAAAVMAFAAQAFAQTPDFDPIYTPASEEVVAAGSSFAITWSAPAKYAGETISIHLIGGATQNTQVPLLDIAAGIANSAGTYTWAVDASLGAAAVYGLVFRLESNPDIFQYSNPFKISASAAPTSTDAGVSASSTVAVTTVPVTTGVKTVTLSSSSASATAAEVTTIVDVTTTVPCNTTAPATSTVVPVVTVGYNCTTTLSKATIPAVITPTGGAVSHTGSPVGPTATPIQITSAGSRLGAGIFATVAGLAIAFAL